MTTQISGIEWKRKRAGLYEVETELGVVGVLKTLDGWVPTIDGVPAERPSRTAEIGMRLAENVIHAKRRDAPRAKLAPKIVDSIVDEAASVLVDDRIHDTTIDAWRRVVATSRLEAGVEIVTRGEDGGEVRRHFLPTDDVEIASIMESSKHGCRLYRVANMRTRGLAVWVAIPEGA